LAAKKEEITLDSVRLMGQGVVSVYPARPGEITIANLCGRKGSYRLTYGVGRAVDAEMVFPGIPVKFQLPCTSKVFLRKTAEFGTGHHWMAAYGNLGRPLEQLGKWMNLKMLKI